MRRGRETSVVFQFWSGISFSPGGVKAMSRLSASWACEDEPGIDPGD